MELLAILRIATSLRTNRAVLSFSSLFVSPQAHPLPALLALALLNPCFASSPGFA